MDFSLFLLGFQHQHLAVLGYKFQLGALCLFQPIFFVLTFCLLSVAFVAKLLGNVTETILVQHYPHTEGKENMN